MDRNGVDKDGHDETQRGAAMSGEVVNRPPEDGSYEPRRRFRRRSDQGPEALGGDAAGVYAELLLLREENARLKAAQHQRADVSRLIGRARSLTNAELDHDSLSDDVEQLLVEGLLIRESLLEICQEIERSMVAFEGKLNALADLGPDRQRPAPAPTDDDIGRADGYGASTV
jgi:hypothetical protein